MFFKMYANIYLSLILFILIFTIILTDKQNESSFWKDMTNYINEMDSDLLDTFLDSESGDNKFGYLHELKYTNQEQLQNCVNFHDSEVVSLDLRQFIGRWDLHLQTPELPFNYEYGQVHFDENEHGALFKYIPENDYHSMFTIRNDTKMVHARIFVKGIFEENIAKDMNIIAINYNSFFLSYSCVQMFGKVSEALKLHLRHEMNEELDKNPDLFSQILDTIPEKSLNKIKGLIPKLIHENNKIFKNFGEKYSKILTQRLDNYRNDNQLSDKSDDQVFDYLNKTCAHFKEEELVIADLSEITHHNWTLDYTDAKTERITFNRLSAQRLSNNNFKVSLFLGKKFLADSDHYWDRNARGYWTYTEGLRSLEVILYSTHEHRIVYSCEENHLNGKLKFTEKLRYFSAENKTKRRSLIAYLNRLTKNFTTNTLIKISHLHKNMSSLRPLHDQHPYHHDEL